MARGISRGMIQVRGITYRIERSSPHCYRVVRLLDDLEVGTFKTHQGVRIDTLTIELSIFREIVQGAMRSARTSAVMHAAPILAPDEDTLRPPAAVVRSPSSMPPSPAMV